jgi:hypothetical protein
MSRRLGAKGYRSRWLFRFFYLPDYGITGTACGGALQAPCGEGRIVGPIREEKML